MDCFVELFYGSFGMATLIQKVARMANQTFQQVSKDRQFFDNFNKLKCLTNQVRKSDVCLVPEQLGLDDRLWTVNSREAPVSYIEIFESDIFTLGIFVLKNGARIPLHDHPNMYGIVKVLHGKVCVQSYSRIAPEPSDQEAPASPHGRAGAFAVKKCPIGEFSEDSEPCCLTPDDANYHEIKAVGGVAAFLDILAPPYDHRVRECHFFKELHPLDTDSQAESQPAPLESDVFLVEIPSPTDYWSNSKPYDGPEVDF